MAVKQEQASEGEFIVERTRSAIPNGDGIRCNLTKEGRDIFDINPGDELTVQVHHDHIRIYPEE